MSDLALQILEENCRTQNPVLDLGNCGLTELPPLPLHCDWVETLILSSEWWEYDAEKDTWKRKPSQNSGERNQIYQLPPLHLYFPAVKKLFIAGNRLTDLSAIGGLVQLQEIYCYQNQLTDLTPVGGLVQLRVLACHQNRLTDLTPVAGLVQLRVLACGGNQLTDLTPVAGLVQLRELYCDGNQLTDLSPIAGLVRLQKLDCGGNRLTDLSPVQGLTQLQVLNCRHNRLTDLSPIRGLVRLQKINCGGNELMDLTPVAGLIQLHSLYCSGNRLTDLSAVAGLVQLRRLDCHSNRLTDLTPVAGLVQLRRLNCGGNELMDLSAVAGLVQLRELYCDASQLTDLSAVSDLVQLRELDCGSNRLTDLSPVRGLVQLQRLDCSDNQVTDLSPVASLVQLRELDCSSNRLTDLSPVRGLVRLLKIDCSGNLIKDLAPLRFLIEKGQGIVWSEHLWPLYVDINIYDNPLQHPPVEIWYQGREAVLNYFDEKAHLEQLPEPATVKVREAKVLIVGQGGAGKTCLRLKLKDPKSPLTAPGDSTRGIEITCLDDERMPHTGERLRLNVWDFGGQNIQHFVHQLFLTGNALYVLITNERIQDHVHLSYWLNIISMLGKDSPILLVQNMVGEHCEPLRNEAAIQAAFPNVQKPVYQTDISKAETEENFKRLRQRIIETAAGLPHIEREYLRSFVILREKIEALATTGRHYLKWQDYLDLMPTLHEALMRNYAIHLTYLGVCQFFPEDALLRDYVFLRPKWLIDAMFTLILHEKLEKSRGFFTEADTLDIWSGKEYAGMHALLVRMMKEFELCYRVGGDEERYIVPHRLPGENQSYGWREEGGTEVVIRFEYVFLPKGILTRLICRMHRRILNDPERGPRVWCDAVILVTPDGKGKVFAHEVWAQNVIEVRATGEKASEMLNQVIQVLDDIHTDPKTRFQNLQVEKMVPCPCAECQRKTEEQRFAFKFSTLQKAIDKNITELRCDQSLDNVLVDEIFGKSGVRKPRPQQSSLEGRGRPLPAEDEKSNALLAFFSYSKEDAGYLKEFQKHLRPLQQQGLLRFWDDRRIAPGEEWDEAIKEALERSDLIFLLVSADFLSTDYIWKTEITAAMRRHHSGEAKVIPIKIRKCDWEGTPFEEIQGIPRKDAYVGSSPKNDEVWTEIVREIRAQLQEWKPR